MGRARVVVAAVAALVVMGCVVASSALAVIPASLITSCTAPAPKPGYDYKLCDDGKPPMGVGGRFPNATGANAVTVPEKYQTPMVDSFTGLPPATTPDPGTGADATGNIALDVDITYPTSTGGGPQPGAHPLMFMMHGCCSGNKTNWEDTSFEGPGEKWHYNNVWFASRGYVVVTYTSRGFVDGQNRGSTGENQLDSRSYEINDYQSLACQVTAQFNDPAAGAALPDIDPARVVATGGSYGGGFAWMALTDPQWSCSSANVAGQTLPGFNMSLAAVAPRYGWTDLAYSLVPTGTHLQEPGTLPRTNGCDSGPVDLSGAACTGILTPFGLPKRSINDALFATGNVLASDHTTFPTSIDSAFACLMANYPFSPACETQFRTLLPEFMRERSAYYQTGFFQKIASDASYRIPVFDAATLTDPLFTDVENRRMINRLRSVGQANGFTYPVEAYYGDYQHFVQNKAKVWSDTCGADDHRCGPADYPVAGGLPDYNAAPGNRVRQGVTSRLNSFIDAYARPPADPSLGQPSFDVTAELLVCPQNASSLGVSADDGGPQIGPAPAFEDLAPHTLTVDLPGAQMTTSTAGPNPHAVNTDPFGNLLRNGGKCAVDTSPAGPGVASYTSAPLTSKATMVGATRVTVDFTATGQTDSMQMDARLYDIFPNGDAVLMDRGPRRLLGAEAAAGRVTFELHGNAWRFEPGHRVRIELAQDDDPFVHRSESPSSATLSRVGLVIPIVEASETAAGGPTPADPGGVTPPPGGGATLKKGPCANVTVGSSKADSLKGTKAGDRIRGRAGNDTLRGFAGVDCLAGQGGKDKLFGGAGRDRLNGAAGRDRLVGGKGPDKLTGGPGADFIDARGGGKDVVLCGKGRDTVRADRRDRLKGCERRRLPG